MSKSRKARQAPSRGPYEEKTPEPTGNCSICIDELKDPSSLDSCSHFFCYECITEWSKTMNTCPLCRERFHKINCKTKKVVKVRNRNIEPSHYATNFIPSQEDFGLGGLFSLNQMDLLAWLRSITARRTQPVPPRRRVPAPVLLDTIDLTQDEVPTRPAPRNQSNTIVDLDDDVVEINDDDQEVIVLD